MTTVKPLGGAQEIGASSTLVEAGGVRLLVDFGLRPQSRMGEERYPDRSMLEGAVDAVLLTHAHMDHTGGLPLLVRDHPDIPVFATSPSIWISEILLRDAHKIMERDWEGPVDFDVSDLETLSRSFVSVEYGERMFVVDRDGVRIFATFHRAGHILGASMISLEVFQGGSPRPDRILFSGDVSLFDQRTISGADLESVRGLSPDVLVCEGTYGDEAHPELETEEDRFLESVDQALERGGRVLIPAFAVGRSQNVALILQEAVRQGRMGGVGGTKVPIFVDGMCRSICDVYNLSSDELTPSLRRYGTSADHLFFDPSGHVRRVDSARLRRNLISSQEPAVIIASSGMLTGGASVAFAKRIAGERDSAILFCGYQDEESPGAILTRLEAGRRENVRLGDIEVDFHCQVGKYSLSAHSDRDGIASLVEAVRPRQTLLVHGEPSRLSALRSHLRDEFRGQPWLVSVDVAGVGSPVSVAEGRSTDSPPSFQQSAQGDPSRPLDAWVDRQLLGLHAPESVGFDPRRTWFEASRTFRMIHPMSDEEVARLGLRHRSLQPLRPSELSVVRATMAAGSEYWETFVGDRQRIHFPSGPNLSRRSLLSMLGPGASALGGRRERPEVAVAPPSEEASDGMASYWTWAEEQGIDVGDLVLFVTGGALRPGIPVGLVKSRVQEGFEVFSSGLVGSARIPVSKVLARISRWPNLMRQTHALPGPADIDLLESLNDVASVLVVEQGLVAAMASEGGEWRGGRLADATGVGRIMSSLWIMQQEGGIEPLTAIVGLELAGDYDGEEQSTIDVKAFRQRLAARGVPSSMAVLRKALQDLERAGLLEVVDLSDPVVVRWEARVLAEGAMVSRSAERSGERIGPELFQKLRASVERAITEVTLRGGLVAEPCEEVQGGDVHLLPPRRLETGGEG